MALDYLNEDIERIVALAIAEDLRDGDITAELIDSDVQAHARIITREAGVFVGTQYIQETFNQLDPKVVISMQVQDGDLVSPDDLLFTLDGSARSLLTGERTALNFVQLLSGTATVARQYADKVAHTSVRILDTRKTIPGLRNAQKYAVTMGGCYNHRVGLYDAFLIKENHIAACGGIGPAVKQAQKNHPGKPVEIETESLDELREALKAGADIVMLDNFSLDDMRTAVELTDGAAKLEASGNVTDQTLVPIAETGVDYISIGALTKHVRALDLSMRLG